MNQNRRDDLRSYQSQLDDERIYAIIEKISLEVSMAAVKQTLVSLGIDHRDPIGAQKDMAALRELRILHSDKEFQKDLAQLRALRASLDQVKLKGFIAAVGLLCTGGLALILYALKGKIF